MGNEPVGMIAWEASPASFDPRYEKFLCILCRNYLTPRGWAGSHYINEAQMQHLRDKHGVVK